VWLWKQFQLIVKIVDNTHMKCIHEALDLDWCDCSEEIRVEYCVKLPKPKELEPEEMESEIPWI